MTARNFKIFEWAVVAVSVLLLSTVYAISAEIPQLKEYVNDYAHILNDNYRHNLNERLHKFEVNTPGNPQIVVVTVPNTGDDSIEEFANKTFHNNKIGHKDNNNGVLTVISMDHKMRIEVGYDLEPTLTDSKSSDILNTMKPSMKTENFSKALDDEMTQLFPLVSSGSAENVKTPTTTTQGVSTPQKTKVTQTSKGFPLMTLFILIALGVIAYLVYKNKTKKDGTYNSYNDDPIDPPVPPVTPVTSTNYSNTRTYIPPTPRPYYPPRQQGPFTPPPIQEPAYTPPVKDHSTLKAAAAGAIGGYVASKLTDNDDYSRRSSSYDSTPSYSPPSDSYSSSSSDSSSSSSSDYSGGGGDSGGGGSSDSW